MSNYRGGGSSYGFNSPTNGGGFKHQRSRWSSDNTDENWNGPPQDSPSMVGPPPISHGGPQFGESQVSSFNEQDGNIQPGGLPANQLPSLLQVYNSYIIQLKDLFDHFFLIKLNMDFYRCHL